ncbi:MAG: hypothetical protein IJY65_01365 [Clostridia bacterium]|nr:hypothetical protein [Clostridia bacterium]
MRGKSHSIPIGMIFKKYYCSCCGNRLNKEQTHRVVSKDDIDYYQYHEIGNYPRYDYDVYSYQFKCPNCDQRISYKEQCIINRIQKKLGKKIITSSEIKELYYEAKTREERKDKAVSIIVPILLITLCFGAFFLFRFDKTKDNLLPISIVYLVLVAYSVIMSIRGFYGGNLIRFKQSYSYEKISQMEQLHTYATNNRKLIESSDQCYSVAVKRK